MNSLLKIFLIFLILIPAQSLADATDIATGDNAPISLSPIEKVVGSTQDITSDKYSVQQDNSGLCKYVNGAGGTKELQINSAIFNTDNILMGLSDPKKCPLPGTNFLPPGYPEALSGEFLMSGVICVVQSIILDSMFRVYCGILLWFYQILYALIVIYILFFGLAIVFGLTNDPIKESPKRVLLIMFVFALALNAEVGFTWVFQTFNTVLDTFSNILTRIQPLYDENGQRVYDDEGHLLAENGQIWQPLKTGKEYKMVYPVIDENGNITSASWESDQTIGDGWLNAPTSMPIKNGTFTFTPIDNPLEYSPFRVPAQQWQGKLEGTGPQKTYKVYPVFKELKHPTSGDNADDFIFCAMDVKYNHERKRMEGYPRCHQKNWETVPEFKPYEGTILKAVKMRSGGVYQGAGIPNGWVLKPAKLLDQPGNVTIACNEQSNPRSCRQPFQGILGKVDALFDSVVGDDNAKGLTSLAAALGLWAVGGGAVLSAFLMTGILSMFTAFVQIIWVYVTALMGLVFLMMLAPMFISFKLFKITEPMFKAWASMLFSFMWQPILVLGFVYVLSNATTLDRLNDLAKNELGQKRYEMKGGDGENTTTFEGPGFKEPLYEMPSDYQQVMKVDTKAFEDLQNRDGIYLSKTQREEYRAKKGEFLLTQTLFMLSGVQISDVHKEEEVAKIANKAKASDLLSIYTQNNAVTVNGEIIRASGIDAVKAYVDSGSVPGGSQITIPELQGFITRYNNELGIEDSDAFRGEPANVASPEKPKGEYPPCVKNCPSFKPAYDPQVAASANPTKAQCQAFCLYVHDNEGDMFAYLAGAMIIWIVLNAMTGAFMAKIPKLAASLSKLYVAVTPIFTASQGNKRLGWAVQTRPEDEVYNLGAVFDSGLTSGRPGAIAGIADRLQQLANRRKVPDGQGGVRNEDGKSVYNWGGLWSAMSPAQKRNEEMGVKAYDVYVDLIRNDPVFTNDLRNYVNRRDKSKPANLKEIQDDIIKSVLQKKSGAMPSVYEIKSEYKKILEERKKEAEKGKTGYVPLPGDTGAGDTRMGAIDNIGSARDAMKLGSSSREAVSTSTYIAPVSPAAEPDTRMGAVDTPALKVGGSVSNSLQNSDISQPSFGGMPSSSMNSTLLVGALGPSMIFNKQQLSLLIKEALDPKTGKINQKIKEQILEQLKKTSQTIPIDAVEEAISIMEKEWMKLGKNLRINEGVSPAISKEEALSQNVEKQKENSMEQPLEKIDAALLSSVATLNKIAVVTPQPTIKPAVQIKQKPEQKEDENNDNREAILEKFREDSERGTARQSITKATALLNEEEVKRKKFTISSARSYREQRIELERIMQERELDPDEIAILNQLIALERMEDEREDQERGLSVIQGERIIPEVEKGEIQEPLPEEMIAQEKVRVSENNNDNYEEEGLKTLYGIPDVEVTPVPEKLEEVIAQENPNEQKIEESIAVKEEANISVSVEDKVGQENYQNPLTQINEESALTKSIFETLKLEEEVVPMTSIFAVGEKEIADPVGIMNRAEVSSIKMDDNFDPVLQPSQIKEPLQEPQNIEFDKVVENIGIRNFEADKSENYQKEISKSEELAPREEVDSSAAITAITNNVFNEVLSKVRLKAGVKNAEIYAKVSDAVKSASPGDTEESLVALILEEIKSEIKGALAKKNKDGGRTTAKSPTKIPADVSSERVTDAEEAEESENPESSEETES